MADTMSVAKSATTAKSGKTGLSSKGGERKKAQLTEHARNARLGRELLGHCVFLAVFCVVTIVPADDPNIENFTYSMRSLFLQEDNLLFNTNSSFAGPRFVDVVSVSDYWKLVAVAVQAGFRQTRVWPASAAPLPAMGSMAPAMG